jgi:hypothetical protein
VTDAHDTTQRADAAPDAAVAATLTVIVRIAAATPGREVEWRMPTPPIRADAFAELATAGAVAAAEPPGDSDYDRGFADGAAAGAALGRRMEALRWAEEVERWRPLVRWTAAQRESE